MDRSIASYRRVAYACLACVLLAAPTWAAGAPTPGQGGEQTVTMGGLPVMPPSKNPHVNYDLNLDGERMVVRAPKLAKPDEACGILVYLSPAAEAAHVPPGWATVLDKNKLIFASPVNAGNDQDIDRRCGLAVFAALRVMAERAAASQKVDPARVYVAGYSGGARMAGLLGFYQPDVFHGTIQCCGADFPTPVPQVAPRDPKYADDKDYGHLPATEAEVAAAKANVRFALVTGSRDFRHGFIVDLYHGGFERDGFMAALIDVPAMDHTTASGTRFAEALAFVEGRPTPVAAVSSQPPAPWASKPTDQWPQLLLENNYASSSGRFTGASGFLMRLPTGQAVAVTARHVFGDSLDVPALEKSSTIWTMKPHGRKGGQVHLRKVAWDAEQLAGEKPLDCVVMTVDEPMRWPGEVLIPRQTPPVVGETVYLLGVPYGDKAAQHVYRGTVVSDDDGEAMFAYEFEGTPETVGFSGAPVVDAKGFVLGIHHGKYDQQPDAGHIRAAALDITAVLAAARPPAGSAPHTPPAHAAHATPGVGGGAGDVETSAAKALAMAQDYVAMQRYDTARAKLQAIIASYPRTAAAKKAKEQLASMPQD